MVRLFSPSLKKEIQIHYIPLSDPNHPTEGDRRNKFLLTFTAVVFLCTIGYLTFIYFLPRLIESPAFPWGRRIKFERFLERFGKKYSDEERELRFSAYWKNMEELQKEEGVVYGETKFADWTKEEMNRILTDIPGTANRTREQTAIFFYPDKTVDWSAKGKVSPIKDQGNCGSCWAFAVVAAVESQHAIWGDGIVSLSEQNLMDCDAKDQGCDGGYRPYAMRYVKKSGLNTEKIYPYKGTDSKTCKVHEDEDKYFIDDYKILPADENAIAQWVDEKGPVTFGMKVVKKMFHYKDGIFDPSDEECDETKEGSHAMTIVGFGRENGKDYWLVKNSWGTSWGRDGYLKLARGVNACGAAEYAVAAILD